MGNNVGSWEAHICVYDGDLNGLKSLMQGKANPNVRFRGETLLTTAITRNSPSIVNLLLTKGANPNLKSKQKYGRNETPLITATRYKNLTIVRMLMDSGADMQATNLYGHDAILQAVVENAFEILEYFLEKMTHGSAVHKTKDVCPFLTALRDSSIFPKKNQSLLTLLRYNYRCNCLQAKNLFVSDADDCEYEQHKRLYESIIQNSDTLSWIYLSHCSRIHYMCRFRHTEITFSITGPMKLANLARIAVRETVSKAAMERKGNFAKCIGTLPLPAQTREFLLLKDVSKIITFHYKSVSGDGGSYVYNYYCFIL